MGKNKDDRYMEESEIDLLQPQESTIEEYDLRLEMMEEEVKKLKKIKKRQKKLCELEFEQREILKKMERNSKKNR